MGGSSSALLRKFLPFSRITILLWAWRNRASVMEWLTFGLRAAVVGAAGKGIDDAKAEFRLRANLARDRRTRGAHHRRGGGEGRRPPAGSGDARGPRRRSRTSPSARRGVIRIDDRITHTLGRGGLLKRKAKAA